MNSDSIVAALFGAAMVLLVVVLWQRDEIGKMRSAWEKKENIRRHQIRMFAFEWLRKLCSPESGLEVRMDSEPDMMESFSSAVTHIKVVEAIAPGQAVLFQLTFLWEEYESGYVMFWGVRGNTPDSRYPHFVFEELRGALDLGKATIESYQKAKEQIGQVAPVPSPS